MLLTNKECKRKDIGARVILLFSLSEERYTQNAKYLSVLVCPDYVTFRDLRCQKFSRSCPENKEAAVLVSFFEVELFPGAAATCNKKGIRGERERKVKERKQRKRIGVN